MTGLPESPPSRAVLAAAVTRRLQRGGARKPDVLLVDTGGDVCIVKDFAPRGPLVRAFLGRWVTRREVRAYRRLADHPAVPRLLGSIDPLAFAVEYRPVRRMSGRLAWEAPPGFLAELRTAVRGLHERGVVHLDLRHRSNVGADAEGRPVLIDFGSALVFRRGGLAERWLLPLLARLDERALEKWEHKLARAAGARDQRSAAAAASGEGAGGASDGGRAASRPT